MRLHENHWCSPSNSVHWWILVTHPFRVSSDILACSPYYSVQGPGRPAWAELKAPKYNGFRDVVEAVYKERGIYGFYQGIGVAWAHSVFKDHLTYEMLRLYYRPTRRCFQQIGLMRQETEDGPVEHFARDIKEPTIDLAHLALKCTATVIAYPLNVLVTRLAVHRNPGLQPLSVGAMIKLSFNFDGIFRGFFGGIAWQLLEEIAEGGMEIFVYAQARKHYRKSRKQAADIAANARLIISILVGPLASVALVQRAQSRIAGLCDTTVKPRDILSNVTKSLLLFCFVGAAAVAGHAKAIEGKPIPAAANKTD